MTYAEKTAKIFILVSPTVATGVVPNESVADYSPKSGTGLPALETTIFKEKQPIVKNSEVYFPKALKSKAVIMLISKAENKTNLNNLTDAGTQQLVPIRPGLVKAGLSISKEELRSLVSIRINKNVGIKIIFDVLNNILAIRYKASELVTIIPARGNLVVYLGILKANSKGIDPMPLVTSTKDSTLKFFLKIPFGFKNVLVRSVAKLQKSHSKRFGSFSKSLESKNGG